MVKKLLGAKVVAISAGPHHGLALTAEGRVFGWGKNSDGQLGMGESVVNNLFVPRVISELLGTRILSVSAQKKSSFFIDDQASCFSNLVLLVLTCCFFFAESCVVQWSRDQSEKACGV